MKNEELKIILKEMQKDTLTNIDRVLNATDVEKRFIFSHILDDVVQIIGKVEEIEKQLTPPERMALEMGRTLGRMDTLFYVFKKRKPIR